MLVGRKQEKLDAAAEAIRSKGGVAHTAVVDALENARFVIRKSFCGSPINGAGDLRASQDCQNHRQRMQMDSLPD